MRRFFSKQAIRGHCIEGNTVTIQPPKKMQKMQFVSGIILVTESVLYIYVETSVLGLLSFPLSAALSLQRPVKLHLFITPILIVTR